MGTSAAVKEHTSLSDALRRLWADHVIWTRQYIVAALEESPDAQAAASRLLRNQEDIGNAVSGFYGEGAGAALTGLLKEHITIAVEAIDAALEDNEQRFRELDASWSRNADDIAAFLAGANPNWAVEDLQDLLAQHLKLTKAEIKARFDEDWSVDVERFDDIFTEILTMSDALADGLAAQFDGGAGPADPAAGLRAALRKLWTDHVIWTRQYIVAAVAGRPDADAAAGRLLRNQEDIGNAIVPLYGAAAGEELTRLLKEHIMIAVDLVAAAGKGDERAFARHDKRWEANADEIAAFLAGANPNWPEGDVRDLLGQHLSLTKSEAVARLTQDWDADVAAFDDIFTEILTMADALTDGLVAQFPEHFGAGEPAAEDPRTAAPHAERRNGLEEMNRKAAELAESLTGVAEELEGPATATDPAVGLRTALRKLWTDHVIWTRQYIVAAVAGSPDADAAAGRLLRNQEDIGNAIVPLYGAAAGEELTRLLKEHIMIAVDLVAAAGKGNKRAFARHDKRWEANADEIAAFLAGANPNWPEGDVRDLLGQHLTLTKSEAVARLTQDWDADVAAFDDIFTEILTMADALTDGIVAQFPDTFRPSRPEAGAGVPDGDGRGGDGSAAAGRPGGRTRFHSSLA